MKYATIGSGKIGTALAHTFARKNIEVGIANSRGPETLALWRENSVPASFRLKVRSEESIIYV